MSLCSLASFVVSIVLITLECLKHRLDDVGIAMNVESTVIVDTNYYVLNDLSAYQMSVCLSVCLCVRMHLIP